MRFCSFYFFFTFFPPNHHSGGVTLILILILIPFYYKLNYSRREERREGKRRKKLGIRNRRRKGIKPKGSQNSLKLLHLKCVSAKCYHLNFSRYFGYIFSPMCINVTNSYCLIISSQYQLWFIGWLQEFTISKALHLIESAKYISTSIAACILKWLFHSILATA